MLRNSRRRFLKQAALAAPALLIRQGPVRFSTNPFTLGVASGYPLPDGFVLWTRLAPLPFLGGGMPPSPVLVDWEVATDDRMANVVKHGKALASPEWAHSVHVEVEDLEPNRPYWYRFYAGDEESAIARSRTAPAVDTLPERLRFAFASCQHYEHGYYAAYRHMIEDELDLIFHLGDYIYEERYGNVRVRSHEAPEPITLDDYRNRYARYKSDPDLQAAHAACPWVVTWDDHEVDNDYAGLANEELYPEAWFRRRRAAAYRAYYEHMPLRRAATPLGAYARLYTEIGFGRLARFQVLDDRQYRSVQVCPLPGEGGSNTVADCPERLDSDRTLLGDVQEKWLERNLDRSEARWNILAQQTLMAQLDRAPGEGRRFWTDGWDGYPAARQRLLDFLAERKPANPLVIGGDVHQFWVSDLKTDFDDDHAETIASEIVGSSITSTTRLTEKMREAIQKDNPHIQFGNTDHRGYVRVEIDPESARADLRGLDDVTDPDSGIETLASFVIEDGRPGPRRA